MNEMLELAQVKKSPSLQKKKSAKDLKPVKSPPKETPEMKPAIEYAKRFFRSHRSEFIVSANEARIAAYVVENYKPELNKEKNAIAAIKKSFFYKGKFVPKPIIGEEEKQGVALDAGKMEKMPKTPVQLTEIGAEKTSFQWFHLIPVIGWALALFGVGKKERTQCEQLESLDKKLVVYKEDKSFWRFFHSKEIDEKATIERIKDAMNMGKPLDYKNKEGREYSIIIVTEAGKERITATAK